MWAQMKTFRDISAGLLAGIFSLLAEAAVGRAIPIAVQ